MTFKATIEIMLRPTILDVQGKAVEQAIHSLGDNGINEVRVGKKITLNVNSDSQKKAEDIVKNICDKLLANPIMENFKFNIELVN